ncbi:DUF4097 domain-containing protein [Virgibacillus oceani]
MLNVKKVSLIALLLIVVGVIGAILTFSLNEEMTLTEEREVDAANIERIDIQIDNGSVNIFPTDAAQATVSLEGVVTARDEPNFSVETEGDTLAIQVEEKWRFFRMDLFSASPGLNIYLPEKSYQILTADMNNGAFRAEDLSVKEIRVENDNGSVGLDRILAETTNVSTANGKIELHHVEGDIESRSNNGAISLAVGDLDRDLNLETDNGRITVQTESEPTNAVIDARTDNGRITVFGNSDWDTMIGDGDHEIRLRTNNGRITVEH